MNTDNDLDGVEWIKGFKCVISMNFVFRNKGERKRRRGLNISVFNYKMNEVVLTIEMIITTILIRDFVNINSYTRVWNDNSLSNTSIMISSLILSKCPNESLN